MTTPLASVVIPAHNEEAVLPRCLAVLLAGAAPGELDVVVAANGCRDRTVELARAAGVRVVATDTPGKANALGLGDAECRTFPRIYLDADVELSYESARALVKALGGKVIACAPVPRWELRGVSRLARRVHRVHDALMTGRRVLAGVGVYVLSECAHERIFPLPELLSDDGYVHRSFTADERLSVPDAVAVVRPARTIRAHLKRRVRVRQGNRQLDSLGLPDSDGKLGLGELRALVARRVVSPLDAACYLSVLVIDRVLTRRQRERANWSTDSTSRAGS
jgi:glycosyltransferase involved in cell wall biosynthesis